MDYNPTNRSAIRSENGGYGEKDNGSSVAMCSVLMLAFVACASLGQVANNTSLVGTVKDTSGGAIAGAKVTATVHYYLNAIVRLRRSDSGFA